MVKTKLALIIDSFVISFLLSFIFVLWIKHYIKNAKQIIFLLILINLLLFIVIFVLLCKKNNKKIFKNNNEKFLNQCLNFLSSTNQQTYSAFFESLLHCKKIEKYFFKLDDNFLFINIQTTLTSSDFLTAQEFFILSKTINSKLYFIYKSKDKSFDETASFSEINFSQFSSEILIRLMGSKNCFPIENQNNKSKPTIKNKIKNAFLSKTKEITKKQFKHIFISGISLLILSLVTPFSNYYLIIGSILVIISIISLFRKNIETKSDDSDFLFK